MMHTLLKWLLVLVTIVAVNFAPVSAVSALPCVGHRHDSFRDRDHAALVVSRYDLEPSRIAHPHAAEGGWCCHLCCSSSASATLDGAVGKHIALSSRTASFSMPRDNFLIGITFPPLTGPPRLSV
jgi:hypothetical protein